MIRKRNPRWAQTILIRGGIVVDGTGAKPRRADVRIVNDVIASVGPNLRESAEVVIDAGGKAVTPGFIDAHSHADGGILDNPDAETQIRQGITTSVVGQDGGDNYPLAEWFAKVEQKHVALNFASFVGHGMARSKVLGKDFKRPSTPDEIRQMRAFVAEDMKAGGLGLSSGLEYDPGLYATTDEIIELAKVAAVYNGLYISHVRDEENGALNSFRELIKIAEGARLPAQISHIKLASSPVWGKTGEVFRLMDEAKGRGVDITADIYPYTYWQSGITVLNSHNTATAGGALARSDPQDRASWQLSLDEVGGPKNVLLSNYKANPAWEGKTLTELAAMTQKDAITVIQEILQNGGGSVVVTAMQEKDVKDFIRNPRIMFCTDGGLRGSHPRGAGSYPRVLGKYVREEKVIPLEEAIRKATSLPAWRMGFADRGTLAPGKKADIVLFDPKTVHDTATTKDPRSAPVGLTDVLVNGVPVLRDGKMTGEHPGAVLRRTVR